jgi:hypothetical protein
MTHERKNYRLEAEAANLNVKAGDAELRYKPVRLGRQERFIAWLVAIGTLLSGLAALATFIRDLGKASGWWKG